MVRVEGVGGKQKTRKGAMVSNLISKKKKKLQVAVNVHTFKESENLRI